MDYSSDNVSNISPKKLKDLKKRIEQLQIHEQLEILRILKKGSTKYTENQNGIFLNMATLSPTILQQLESFVDFCQKSSQSLQKEENRQDSFRELVEKEVEREVEKEVENDLESLGDSSTDEDIYPPSSSSPFPVFSSSLGVNTPLEVNNYFTKQSKKNLSVKKEKPVFTGTGARIIKKSREAPVHSVTITQTKKNIQQDIQKELPEKI